MIGPVPGRTPAGFQAARWNLTSIPYDLLQEGSRRVRVISITGAVLWVVGAVLSRLALSAIRPDDPYWKAFQLPDTVAAVSALASLGVFFVSRKKSQNPELVLNVALLYLMATSLALGMLFHWEVKHHGSQVFPMISWNGALVLTFAAIVPSAPMKTLVVGLISVSMNPAGMFLAKARGMWDFGPPVNVLIMHYPDYLLVGVAVVISHVVTRMSRKVLEAREMGSYSLIAPLGRGGMGEVWRARHRMLARDAAIKLIQPEVLSGISGRNAALARRRFEQEARTTAALRSPHTVELYDFGVAEDGVFYYVMELLDGIDLVTLVNKFGPQPAGRVVHILSQVCRSLGDAHANGMIHRDIKPANIFLCRMGNDYDFVKVLDFGLVKVLHNDETQLTMEGVTKGTPAYMAPELALGKPEIDGRCDLYGLGCVAYWLMTGRLVFEERGTTAMMLAHLQSIPVPPSARSELVVTPALDRAILTCLAKDPADRPANADALARLLRDCEDIGCWTSENAENWWVTNKPATAVRPAPGVAFDETLTRTVVRSL